MPKYQGSRKEPGLDMNPMVDMAFLLVCFFMMTTTFKSEMPIEIAVPFARADLKIPDKDVCTISIDKEGHAYLGLDNKYDRKQMLTYVARQNGFTFSLDQAERFSLLSSFGVSFTELDSFLDLEKVERKAFDQNGIPYDKGGNELKAWIIGARMANPNLRFAINGDDKTGVRSIQEVFNVLQDLNITRFNLITDKQKDAS